MSFKNDKNFQREIIIENYENPNKKIAENFTDDGFESCNLKSNSCIDNLTLFLKINNNKILEAFFNGTGCAVSTASMNIFCNIIINKDIDIVFKIINEYIKMLKGESFNSELLEELNIFIDIKNQPNRINCALIAPLSIEKILIKEK